MKKTLTVLSLVLLIGCTAHQHNEKAGAYLDQGISYYNQKQYTQAMTEFRRADQLGHMKAPRYIGLMYLNGEGVIKNELKAFSEFQKAATKGDITAQYWIGYCYEQGIGTEKNIDKAISYYKQSAARGDKISQPAIDALKRLAITQ